MLDLNKILHHSAFLTEEFNKILPTDIDCESYDNLVQAKQYMKTVVRLLQNVNRRKAPCKKRSP